LKVLYVSCGHLVRVYFVVIELELF